MKSVTFSENVAFDDAVGSGMRCRRGACLVLMVADQVWKFVGARHGIQEVEEVGMGFEGWTWRNSIAY